MQSLSHLLVILHDVARPFEQKDSAHALPADVGLGPRLTESTKLNKGLKTPVNIEQ